MIKGEDIGILLILTTWITTLAKFIYNTVTGIDPTSIEAVIQIGKDASLFILNIILFMSGLIILLRAIKDRVDEVKSVINTLYFYPIINIIIASIFSVSLLGLDGLIIFIKAPFISMYNFIIFLSIFIIELRIIGGIEIIYKKDRLPVIIALQLFTYIALRIMLGPSFYLMAIFLIIILLTTIIALYKWGG